MTERLPKSALVGGIVLASLILAYAAFSRPWYFTDKTYLGGIVLLELLLVAVWLYRSVFFPAVIVAFLLAGVDLPVGAFWTQARWAFLVVGAFAGFFLMLRYRGHRFGLFHAIALFAVSTAVVSAAVSHYPNVVLLKALSLFLLFLYAGTGARLAVHGRENQFFNGLIIGCEIFVGANAAFKAVGIEAMGNPNSLAAVTGVVCAPILLWGALVGGERSTVLRRWILYAVCMYLVFASHARAGMAAALLSSGLLCLALRKYKMAVEGSVILVIVLAATAIFRPEFLSALTSDVVYKGADQQLGVLASRESPWRTAIHNIREHPWLGTGFGTTASGEDTDDQFRAFSSSLNSTAENGSSYLAITSGVGVLGMLPFALLIMLIVGKVFKTIAWMRKTASPVHPAVPLAIVMVAGMAHAAFEDWMFAPGYYLCVFFWSLAFILVDVAPIVAISAFAFRGHAKPTRRPMEGLAAIR
jgi:O-antigen ligase